jgi:hypothetical protein
MYSNSPLTSNPARVGIARCLIWGRKQNVWFSELTVESGPSHYRRSKVGGAGDEEFARLVAEMEESGKPLDSFMV